MWMKCTACASTPDYFATKAMLLFKIAMVFNEVKRYWHYQLFLNAIHAMKFSWQIDQLFTLS